LDVNTAINKMLVWAAAGSLWTNGWQFQALAGDSSCCLYVVTN
jgi:hypothetical protein